jgi:hypothetical protein
MGPLPEVNLPHHRLIAPLVARSGDNQREATLPRASTRPKIVLALSKSGAAAALGVKLWRINDALDTGLLVARKVGNQIRIPVFGPQGLQEWFDTWPLSKRKS